MSYHRCFQTVMRHVGMLCWLSAITSTVCQESTAADWRFGVAKVCITPEQPMLMSGYASRDTPATGKLTELWAKALVLEDGTGKRCALITVDLVGIGRDTTQRIGVALRGQPELHVTDFAICCSHTHTGPALANNLSPMHYYGASPEQRTRIEKYTSNLELAIVQVVGQAVTRLQPGTLAWGNGQSAFATNRRNNGEPDVPRLRSEGTLQGPFDHDVPVLACRDAQGTLGAVVFGYACHATVLSFDKWSGDYPGFAQLELEQRFPKCVAMFWAGCGADQNPLPRRTVLLAEHYGRRLAVAVEDVLLTHELQPIEASLACRSREIPLAFASLPTAEELTRDAKSKNPFEAARAVLLMQQQERQELAPDYPYPLALWRLGDMEWVFLGGEVVVDYALRLKREGNATRTWVAGYANDVMAYIPSERVLREGGYEGGGAMVYYGLPSPWAAGLEKQIVDTVKQLRDELSEN